MACEWMKKGEQKVCEFYKEKLQLGSKLELHSIEVFIDEHITSVHLYIRLKPNRGVKISEIFDLSSDDEMPASGDHGVKPAEVQNEKAGSPISRGDVSMDDVAQDEPSQNPLSYSEDSEIPLRF